MQTLGTPWISGSAPLVHLQTMTLMLPSARSVTQRDCDKAFIAGHLAALQKTGLARSNGISRIVEKAHSVRFGRKQKLLLPSLGMSTARSLAVILSA